ncbi:HesA/MoeB/ThiF family protein [Pseudoglutamicibacter albus]|uniref:HesA/MoeB/ThiF family protein n=1 Tax=Pseudoglutamicibacter albus TaxID=98671 RepID=UPI0018DBA388|nr:ThiF family adenylyltransferase [Pseudoglutamicibacter albus]
MKVQKSQAWSLEKSDQSLVARSEIITLTFRGVGATELPADLFTGVPLDASLLPNNLYQELKSRNIIVNAEYGQAASERFSRQHDYLVTLGADPNLGHLKITEARVGIIGVGALGSCALQAFVGAGVQKFTLIDPDVVCPSNMNRQYIYGSGDIGRPKVDVAKHWVVDRAIRPEITTHFCSFHDLNAEVFFHEVDFVVATFDGPSMNSVLSCLCQAWDNRVASVFGATGFNTTVISPVFMPGRSRSPEECILLSEMGGVREPIRASWGPISLYNSALLAEQALLHLLGLSDEVNYTSFHKTLRRRGVVSIQTTESLRF